MRFDWLVLYCLVCGCSRTQNNAVPPEALRSLVFEEFGNTQAPPKFVNTVLLALKDDPIKFRDLGEMSPEEHKVQYFEFGVGVTFKFVLGKKQYELGNRAILDRVGMQAYKCELGEKLSSYMAVEFRKFDELGLDVSQTDNLAKAFNNALEALEASQ